MSLYTGNIFYQNILNFIFSQLNLFMLHFLALKKRFIDL